MSRCSLALLATAAMALRPTPIQSLAARRDVLGGLAGAIFAPSAAFAATSEELKGMLGKLDDELSDEGLAKSRKINIEDKGKPGLELPKVSAPKINVPAAPKLPKVETGAVISKEDIDLGSVVPDFGASAREEGRRRAEARRAAKVEREQARGMSEVREAPSSSADVGEGEVYAALRAKREAQRAEAEARAEQRAYNRLTPAEQAKKRATGKR
eukprot:CAMPEP_0119276588 /NCGR_PEP_ID=MMETSP1329-20130426/15686_1 /TAXON_ID=114041 /ORGANISM="Genus nov. species nov., Strain RCC1024" /LENGTH=212 /DNA_ID=CAMNT_0007277023 /DNA_START=83 /DNA_END=721 /DNA_ORIENTATION=+